MKEKSNPSVTAAEKRRRTKANVRSQRKSPQAKVPAGRRAVAATGTPERQRGEEILRRLAQFPAENPGPVLRIACNGVLLYANEPARGWLAALGWHAKDRLPDSVLSIVTEARGQNQVIRREITSPGGRTLLLSGGQPPKEDYVNIYGNDITDLKLAQEALRASEERLDLAFRGAQDGIWDWNMETDEVFYSSRWKTMLGFDESEIEPHASAWRRLMHPDDMPRALQVVEDVLHGKRDYVMEFRMRHKDGHYVDVLSRGFPVRRGLNGPIVRIVGTHFDLTERKRAEEEAQRNRAEIAHLSRVAMLSQLSGSLAHELNQPLAAVLSNAQAALRFLAEDNVDLNELRDILKDIVSDNRRASEVIRRLRLLLKKGEFEPLPLDMNEVVQDVLNLVHSELLDHGIVLQTGLADKLPLVKGDRVQLEQVLLNLIVNAYEAMANTVPADRQLIVRTAAAGDYVHVSVVDRGTGIAPDIFKQMFAPFFTTKATGLGLGLPVSHTIISTHGGYLTGKNNLSQGATFEVLLPIGDKKSI